MRSQLVDEVENRPRRLTVETRRWFIQKQKQLWLGRKLNSDRQTLALLNIKTYVEALKHTISTFPGQRSLPSPGMPTTAPA